jgi:hypothetical protein
VYLLVKLTAIGTFFGVTAIILGSCGFVGTVMYALEAESYRPSKNLKTWKPYLKNAWIGTVIFAILCVATPTTKQAAVIWLLPKIVNNEQVQAVPEKALKLLNKQMDEWLEENLKLEDKKE